MRRRNLSIFATLPLVVLAIAGCGGGDDDDSTSTEPVATIPTTTAPTREELIARGDGICAEVNAAVGSVGTSETGVEAQRAQVADLYIGMVQSLDGLGTPDDASGFAEFSAAADELSTAESEVKLAAEREDTVGIEAAEANATPALEDFQAAADAYGFEDCSEGPSAPAAPAETPPSVEEEAPVEAPEAEEVAPEEAAPEEIAPETGGAGSGSEGGGTSGGSEGGGGTTGGDSGGIGPG